MSTKRVDVFISSTTEDLREYRAAVRDAVLALDYFPMMMEEFMLKDEPLNEYALDKVDEAEIYIGIFAHRYGWIPPGSDISITEMEFNRATERGIPRLCFLLDEKYPWPAKYIDAEHGRTKLQRLKKRITSNLAAFFTTPQSLQAQVATSLLSLNDRLQPNSRIGSYHVSEGLAIQTSLDKTTKVQLVINGEVAEFDNETLVNALKGMLGLNKDDIKILRVPEG